MGLCHIGTVRRQFFGTPVRNVGSIDVDLSRNRWDQLQDRLEQRRFTDTVFTEDTEDIAAPHGNADIFDDGFPIVSAAKVIQFQNHAKTLPLRTMVIINNGNSTNVVMTPAGTAKPMALIIEMITRTAKEMMPPTIPDRYATSPNSV